MNISRMDASSLMRPLYTWVAHHKTALIISALAVGVFVRYREALYDMKRIAGVVRMSARAAWERMGKWWHGTTGPIAPSSGNVPRVESSTVPQQKDEPETPCKVVDYVENREEMWGRLTRELKARLAGAPDCSPKKVTDVMGYWQRVVLSVSDEGSAEWFYVVYIPLADGASAREKLREIACSLDRNYVCILDQHREVLRELRTITEECSGEQVLALWVELFAGGEPDELFPQRQAMMAKFMQYVKLDEVMVGLRECRNIVVSSIRSRETDVDYTLIKRNVAVALANELRGQPLDQLDQCVQRVLQESEMSPAEQVQKALENIQLCQDLLQSKQEELSRLPAPSECGWMVGFLELAEWIQDFLLSEEERSAVSNNMLSSSSSQMDGVKHLTGAMPPQILETCSLGLDHVKEALQRSARTDDDNAMYEALFVGEKLLCEMGCNFATLETHVAHLTADET